MDRRHGGRQEGRKARKDGETQGSREVGTRATPGNQLVDINLRTITVTVGAVKKVFWWLYSYISSH